jgi:uncharacterized protein (TIGR03382 family)
MKPIDLAKALGIAALVLALDLCLAVGAVTVWAWVVEPGHSQAEIAAAAPRLSTLSTRVFGPLLLLAFVWLFSRRKPGRNAFAFAATVFVLYLVLDGATVAFHGLYNQTVLITVILKLIGAVAGATLARAGRVGGAAAVG